MEIDLSNFEKSLDISFRNKDLLREALTHRSYLNEHPSWHVPHNERLEYLGDAVLQLAVSEHLFKKFSEREEGELTAIRAALVNAQMLGRIARNISLDKWIFLSRGEAKDSGKARDIILANAFEAFLGSLYLDQGYIVAQLFVEKNVFPYLQEIIDKKLYVDPKSLLQELIQEKMKTTPIYRVLKEEGPDHQKKFSVGVFFGEVLAAQGEGYSKQEAEVSAAERALSILQKK